MTASLNTSSTIIVLEVLMKTKHVSTPLEMNDKEINIVKYITHNEKASQIIDALLTVENLYFNQISEKIGGSRSLIAEVLYKLEKLGALTGGWEIKELKIKDAPKSRAVKNYQINENYSELLHGYQKLFV